MNSPKSQQRKYFGFTTTNGACICLVTNTIVFYFCTCAAGLGHLVFCLAINYDELKGPCHRPILRRRKKINISLVNITTCLFVIYVPKNYNILRYKTLAIVQAIFILTKCIDVIIIAYFIRKTKAKRILCKYITDFGPLYDETTRSFTNSPYLG